MNAKRIIPSSCLAGVVSIALSTLTACSSSFQIANSLSSVVAAPVAPISPSPVNNFRVGVNLSGLESGSNYPGTAGTDYQVPTSSELDYYKSRGMLTLRLPIAWQRVQPNVGGALDATYLGYIQTLLSAAAVRNMKLILDIHNYATRPEGNIGTVAVPIASFADLWTKLSGILAGNLGLGGYDLMNEPVNIDSTTWVAAAQAAINAIRTVDLNTKIYVEGSGYASAWQWTSLNPTLNTLTDPSNNLVFSAHVYLDRDSSGSHFIWATEVAAGSSAPGTVPEDTNIGVARLQPFVTWLQKYGFKGYVGEIGVGNDDPNWNVALTKTLTYAQSNGLEVDIWAAGPGWGTYPMTVEFGNFGGLQAKQMVVLTNFTGAKPEPSTYNVTGPNRGSVGAASGLFTIDYRGRINTPVVVTFSDGGLGGTFTPSTLTLPVGDNAIATFTYAVNSAVTATITLNNSAGWTNPPALGYATATDLFQGSSANPTNILAFRRMFAPYIGPLVRLQRDSDSVQSDFGMNSHADLDRAAITTWAGGSTLHLVKWYDQSANGNHAQPVYSDNSGGASASADYPVFQVNGGDGYPVITFSANRMDLPAPLTSITGQSIITYLNHSSGERMLSAQFSASNNWPNDGGTDWNISSETGGSISMGLVANAWHLYQGTWAANTVNGWKTFRDGTLVTQANSTAASWSLDYNRNTYNMGYDRFYTGSHWYGQMREVILFSSTISAGDVASFNSSIQTYYSTPLP